MNKLYVTKIWIEKAVFLLRQIQGQQPVTISPNSRVSITFLPRGSAAFIVVGGKDVYWPELDMDINLEGMFYDNNLFKLTDMEDSVVYRPQPESNDCVAEPEPNNKCKDN